MRRRAPRRRGQAVLGSGLALVLAMAVALSLGELAAPAPALAWRVDFKVMSYNVRGGVDKKGKRRFNELAELVALQLPDLVALQEIGAKDVDMLGRLTALLNSESFSAYGNEPWRARVGVLSRWPFELTTHAMPGAKRKYGRVAVDMQGIPLIFYTPHFSRAGLVDSAGKGLVKEFLGMGPRAEQMAGLAKSIDADRHRFKLLAGDLNTFPMSGPYRELAGVMEDAFPSLLGQGTYRLDELNMELPDGVPSPRIDHIFHSEGLKVVEAEVITQGHSDHFPVMAVMSLNVNDFPKTAGDVRRAQERLIKLGLLKGPASDELGPAARRAVAKFQEKNGLIIDGILTEKTWDKLML